MTTVTEQALQKFQWRVVGRNVWRGKPRVVLSKQTRVCRCDTL